MTKALFSETITRNVFTFSILSKISGPTKALIYTHDNMTSNEFAEICKLHTKAYIANAPMKNIIAYICEQTGWSYDEYYNKYDYAYLPNDQT